MTVERISLHSDSMAHDPSSNMDIPQSIQRQGFRKWYERQLLAGHSHLLLVVLCAVAVALAVEAYSAQADSSRLQMLASVFAAAAIGLWALRRYLFLLMRAEFIANQAVCGHCKTYGRWAIESAADADERTQQPPRMRVCCRKCEARWVIEW